MVRAGAAVRLQIVTGLVAALAACSTSSGFVDAPEDDWDPSDPAEPPSTGTQWVESEEEDGCGRVRVVWKEVDEICGDPTSDLAHLRAPLYRDGARVGDHLYVVDGTHLWTLDVADDTAPTRVRTDTGLGLPVAVAASGDALWVAAGPDGLVRLDVSVPEAPVVVDRLRLPGVALDVEVRDGHAFVALAQAGLAVVDVSVDPPAVVAVHPLDGLAAGVTVEGALAYVAACEGVTVVDWTTGEVVGGTWLDPDSVDEDRTPAKDVALDGDLGFVAAGEAGAVIVDLADPTAPVVLGACRVDDPLFYASGVRVQDGRVYVAGGEWGVLAFDVDDLGSACDLHPPVLETPAEPAGCSDEPPWDVVSWQDVLIPRPPIRPGRDPIQTLPYGDVLYAFGDATRVGLRAVDVRDVLSPTLDKVGRYEPTRQVEGIAVRDGRLLVVGPTSGVWNVLADAPFLARDTGVVVGVPDGIAGTLTAAGRWAVATRDGQLHVEGLPDPVEVAAEMLPNAVVSAGAYLVAPGPAGSLAVVDLDHDAVSAGPFTSETAHLPLTLGATDDAIVAASGEWIDSVALTLDADGALQTTRRAAHGVFDDHEIEEVQRWRDGVPRRLFAPAAGGVVELAAFGGKAALVRDGGQRLALPPATWVAMTAADDVVYLGAAERASYQSRVLKIRLGDDGPVVEDTLLFTGVVTGLAVEGDRLYVADADAGIRVLTHGDGPLTPLGVVPVAGGDL